jgi:hypothetical protein
MSAAPDAGAANSRCSRCGAPFRCGMEGGDNECWCAGLPPLMPLPAASDAGSSEAGCLCPACLQARLVQVGEFADEPSAGAGESRRTTK